MGELGGGGPVRRVDRDSARRVAADEVEFVVEDDLVADRGPERPGGELGRDIAVGRPELAESAAALVRGVEQAAAAGGEEVVDRTVGRAVIGVLDQLGASGGAVGDPELVAVAAVIGDEEQFAPRSGELAQRRRVRPGKDVADHMGAGSAAVADPQFVAVGRIVSLEEERASDHGEQAGVGERGHEAGAAGAPIGLEQAGSVRRVRAQEEQGAVDVDQIGAVVAIARAGQRVGARRAAVAAPEVGSHIVAGGEIHDSVGLDEIGVARRIDARIEIPHHERARRSAVGDPELASMHAVVGEKKFNAHRKPPPECLDRILTNRLMAARRPARNCLIRQVLERRRWRTLRSSPLKGLNAGRFGYVPIRTDAGVVSVHSRKSGRRRIPSYELSRTGRTGSSFSSRCGDIARHVRRWPGRARVRSQVQPARRCFEPCVR